MQVCIFVFIIVAVTPLICGAIDCAHDNGGIWEDNYGTRRSSCFYARKKTGEQRGRCDIDFNDDGKWPLDFDPNMTPMNKCIKPPGLAAFKRCNDKHNCNRVICTDADVVPWPESSYNTTLGTTIEPSTGAPTTPEAVTTGAPMARGAASSNSTSGIVDSDCENGKNNQSRPLGLPLTNVFDNKQVNVVYNIPATSNSCECRCGQNKAQNTFIAV